MDDCLVALGALIEVNGFVCGCLDRQRVCWAPHLQRSHETPGVGSPCQGFGKGFGMVRDCPRAPPWAELIFPFWGESQRLLAAQSLHEAQRFVATEPVNTAALEYDCEPVDVWRNPMD
jgi:hypothetical protein